MKRASARVTRHLAFTAAFVVGAAVTSFAAPTVVTLAATDVTATTARLNGTVTPNGTNTTALFDYGATQAYGSQATASPNPGAGASPVAVSATITGLTCNTSYHFRLVATGGGSVQGAIRL